jgi:hypothetical protein
METTLVKSPHNTEIINHQREIPANSTENNMPPIFVVVKSGSTFLAEERRVLGQAVKAFVHPGDLPQVSGAQQGEHLQFCVISELPDYT